MSTWEKLMYRVKSLSDDLRFEEIKKVLEEYGYEMKRCGSAGSHCTFRKEGRDPLTIPKHGKHVKVIYVKLVKKAVEEDDNNG